MNFENNLIPGVFIKRYKRFFVDVKLNGDTVVAHCPNTGSMLGLLKEGNKVWLTKSNNPKRKLKYTLQLIEENGVQFLKLPLWPKLRFESGAKLTLSGLKRTV